MDKSISIPCIFYLYLQSKLNEYTNDSILSLKEAEWRLYQWKIPKQLRPLMIIEMEKLNLISREDRRTIKINKCNFNIEELGNYYKVLNCY